MKILLVNPPVRDFFDTPLRRQPLGLLYLAAALMRRGHQVALWDAGAKRRSRRIATPEFMRDAVHPGDALDTSPFKLFGRFHHYGPSFNALEEDVRNCAPDVIGISSLFNAYALEALACADRARRAAPAARIVLGGGHPSSAPKEVIENPSVDFAVLGEGEEAFPRLLDAFLGDGSAADIPGVAGRNERGKVFVNAPQFREDIEGFAPAARELLDLDAYHLKGRPMAQILSSRGCPLACTFCSAHLTSGSRFRPRDPARVVQEMLDCRDRFGIEAFDFEDDNLAFDEARAARLMDLIVEAFGREALWLEAMNGISMKGLTDSLLRKMRSAGFRNLNLSPLTTHSKVHARMNRPEDPESTQDRMELAIRLGFRVTAYLMVGYPGQTLTEMMESLVRMAEKPVLLAPSVFYPAPGSRAQREYFPDLGSADEKKWALMRSSLFTEVPGGVDARALRTVFWMIRLANFARSLVPDRNKDRLRILASSASTPDPRGDITSSRALDAKERGSAALRAYLLERRPYGIRVVKRGKGKGAWQYRLIPLEGMIEERSFFTRYGVPGFGAEGLWMQGHHGNAE